MAKNQLYNITVNIMFDDNHMIDFLCRTYDNSRSVEVKINKNKELKKLQKQHGSIVDTSFKFLQPLSIKKDMQYDVPIVIDKSIKFYKWEKSEYKEVFLALQCIAHHSILA